VEVRPAEEHRATVIWLHGLGADGHDFEPIVPALRLPDALGVRFVFPEAPVRPVTINGGAAMRAWFDIESVRRDSGINREHLAESVAGVRTLARLEAARGIPPERLVLAGFSQGGAVVLHAATCPGPNDAPPVRLAGVLALSAYLPAADRIRPAADPPTPIFQAHGSFDPMIPVHFASLACRTLTGAGWPVEYHEYPMAHQVTEAEIRDIGLFLRRVLGADPGGRPA
jgi:phospholipase/carboxylesterase